MLLALYSTSGNILIVDYDLKVTYCIVQSAEYWCPYGMHFCIVMQYPCYGYAEYAYIRTMKVHESVLRKFAHASLYDASLL